MSNSQKNTTSLIISGAGRELSKEEKTFNTRLKKVQKLRADNIALNDALNHYAARYAAEVAPVDKAMGEVVFKRALNMRQYAASAAVKTDQAREKVRAVIQELWEAHLYELEPTPETKDLFQYIYSESYEDAVAADEAGMKAEFADFAKATFGDVGIDWESLDPDNPAEFIGQLHEAKARQEEEADARRARRKVSSKAAQAEALAAARKQLEERPLKDIYRKLSAVLHPDKAGSEEERVKLEELMKRLTTAKDARDLPALLQLEMEVFSTAGYTAADDPQAVLKLYNKLLQEQIRELEQERFLRAQDPRFEHITHWLPTDLKRAPRVFNDLLADRREELQAAEMLLQSHESGPSAIRRDVDIEWQRIQEESSGDIFGAAMMELFREMSQREAAAPKPSRKKR